MTGSDSTFKRNARFVRVDWVGWGKMGNVSYLKIINDEIINNHYVKGASSSIVVRYQLTKLLDKLSNISPYPFPSNKSLLPL